MSAGTAVFSTGFSIGQLAALVSEYDLDVVSLHLKTPYNDAGVVQSIDIGSYDLARFDGPFADRARKAIGVIRYQFLEWSRDLPEADSIGYAEVARSELLIYRCELYGKASDLRRLNQISEISIIKLDAPDQGKEKIEMHRKMMAESKVAWENFNLGSEDTN